MAKEAGQAYEAIVHKYKTTGEKFVDEEFPANNSSIGNLAEIHVQPKWLRPRDIVTRKSREKSRKTEKGLVSKINRKLPEWAICSHIQPSDVSQGTLGDCWFLSSIAVVASKPELIHKLILTPHIQPAGAYRFRLCKDGVWKTVIVDDQLPCNEENRLLFAKAKDKQLWVCLLEKAHAKLYGSYQALQSGHALEGLVTLTGYPAQSINFQGDEEDLGPLYQDVIWQTLFSCQKAGFLIGISCGRPDVSEEEYEKIGLLSCHAYSVLQVRSVSKLRLLHIRNPWGKYSWKGDWKIDSHLWTADLIEKLKPAKHDDGTFWISFEDVLKYFSRADICQLRTRWHENRFEGTLTNSVSSTMSYYKIVVTKPTEFEYALYQPSKRSKDQNGDAQVEIKLDICMIMVSLQEGRNQEDIPIVKRYMGSSPRELSSCVVGKLRESILQPGTYALVPFSIKGLCSRNENKYALSIHSSAEVLAERCEAPLPFLTDCMIEFAVKSGVRKDCSPTIKIYARRFWSGLLLVIENTHAEKTLRVCADLLGSKNVHSSRETEEGNGLEAWDVIPPRFRQVLVVLTRATKHSESVTSYKLKYSHGWADTLENFAPKSGGPQQRHLPPLLSVLHQPRKILAE